VTTLKKTKELKTLYCKPYTLPLRKAEMFSSLVQRKKAANTSLDAKSNIK
jgi:hypothetical protein